MRRRIAKKLKAKSDAKALIEILLKKSKETYKKGNKKLSKTYSKKIRFLYMKHKVQLPKETRRQLCKNCYGILIPSLNCRIRTKQGTIVIYCSDCKKYTRIRIK